ncbi:MAG: hypothetical protein JWR68_2320 [Polaromonas sp.]|nr:hypothetical protein [Polaromonas sp.]
MIKELVQKARSMGFVPHETRDGSAQGIARHPGADTAGLAAFGRRISAERQHIRLLEIQNQELQRDLDKWKKASVGFAHELRTLLND